MSTWRVKPTHANEVLPKEAIQVLRRLEVASNKGQRRRYNKILQRLAKQNPDMAKTIESHMIETPAKPDTLKTLMALSDEERRWIRSWKENQKC
jgi:hypothetical protein